MRSWCQRVLTLPGFLASRSCTHTEYLGIFCRSSISTWLACSLDVFLSGCMPSTLTQTLYVGWGATTLHIVFRASRHSHGLGRVLGAGLLHAFRTGSVRTPTRGWHLSPVAHPLMLTSASAWRWPASARRSSSRPSQSPAWLACPRAPCSPRCPPTAGAAARWSRPSGGTASGCTLDPLSQAHTEGTIWRCVAA